MFVQVGVWIQPFSCDNDWVPFEIFFTAPCVFAKIMSRQKLIV